VPFPGVDVDVDVDVALLSPAWVDLTSAVVLPDVDTPAADLREPGDPGVAGGVVGGVVGGGGIGCRCDRSSRIR